MADHDHTDEHADHADATGALRETSPMQSFTTRQVGLGLLVLAVGTAVAYVLPYLL